MTNEDLDRASDLMRNDIDFEGLADLSRSIEFMMSGRTCREYAKAALAAFKKVLAVVDGKSFQELASLARKTKLSPSASKNT